MEIYAKRLTAALAKCSSGMKQEVTEDVRSAVMDLATRAELVFAPVSTRAINALEKFLPEEYLSSEPGKRAIRMDNETLQAVRECVPRLD